MATQKIALILTCEGKPKRKVLFPKDAGFEAFKTLIARQFVPESVDEISYMYEGETFGIDTDGTLEGYLLENTLPHLMITLSPSHGETATAGPPPRAAVTNALKAISNDDHSVSVAPDSTTAPPQQPASPSAAAAHTNSDPNPPATTTKPPVAATGTKSTADQVSNPALDPLPALPMCTVHLEASGHPPKTVEIPPEQARSMRLEDFMGLLTAQYEGHAVNGAPAVVASTGGISGLVDSPEALHALLTTSLFRPGLLRIPLVPLRAKAEQKKPKKKQKGKEPKAGDAPVAAVPAFVPSLRPLCFYVFPVLLQSSTSLLRVIP
ncbi:hypothetical protein PAPYR_6394 [Paratrimastix pyriformis]|uniref:PB1 domain-containing protein n=1 Tax=Paratrimastix pyriformis TaxID=342808 RepID=A0ABQ8UJ85_9EUKA|nr:hypothetical protein PAPYR_6394 [Paratrimastix pyriformis]